MFAGITPNGAVQLFKDVAAALPDAKLYGPDGVSNPEFFVADEGGIPADVAERVKVTVATLSPGPVPAGGPELLRRVQEALQRAERRPVRDLWL